MGLFGERNTKLEKRTVQDYLNVFSEKGKVKLIENPRTPFDTGVKRMVELRCMKTNRSIFALLYLQRTAQNGRQAVKLLDNYPRFPVPPSVYNVYAEEDRIRKTIEYYTKHNVYFVVILPVRSGSDLFWVARCDSIPEKNLYPNWWSKKNDTTRLLLTGYTKYDFVKEEDLEMYMEKIFDNESKNQ